MSYLGRSGAFDTRLEVRSDVFSANGTQTAYLMMEVILYQDQH
jgi:hypothetical protein